MVSLVANAQPAAPAGLLATAGDEEAVLTWEDPANSNVVRYEFRFGAGEAPTFNAWAEMPGSGADTVEHTVSGLANGTGYVFEVRATDPDGAGEAARASTILAAAPSSAVEVPDAALRGRIEVILRLASGASITQGDLAKLVWLTAHRYSIANLAGLEFAVNLGALYLRNNEIADVSALAGLAKLKYLTLIDNEIADVSPRVCDRSLVSDHSGAGWPGIGDDGKVLASRRGPPTLGFYARPRARRPAMATRTVVDRNEEGKREEAEEAAALAELQSALAELVAGQVRELAAALLASSSRLDGRIREAVLEAGRAGLEQALDADRSDCGAANAPQCGCGERMRYVGRERSPTETALGTVGVAMGRYSCAACGKSARPRSSRLDIEASMTPLARRMASEMGSACCYAEAGRLLRLVGGVNFGTKRVERTTRLVGDDLEAWRTRLLSGSITVFGGGGETANDTSFDGSVVRKPLKEGQILCVGLDGTGVPALPSETAGRKGKDGERATTREAKVGAIWVVEPDGEGGTRLAKDSAWYFAAIESAADDAQGDSPVARRLLRELAALGFVPEDVGVALGDGADWLRRLYEEWFPNAVRIVDFFHAAEYLWAAAQARHRNDPKAAKRWAEKQCRRLEAGRMDDVLAALRRPGAGAEERDKAIRYLSERRGQMRYDEYRSLGLPIGSGRVEAACKTVVGRRMKCTGMRWTVAGANPVLWVRCARLSGWFDDYWEHRHRQAA